MPNYEIPRSRLCSFPRCFALLLRYQCERVRSVWLLLTRDLAGPGTVAYRKPNSIFRKDRNTNEYQSSNHRRLHRQGGWSRTAPNGKSVTRLSVATTKRYKDAEGTWQEKTQWHTCVAYGPIADHAAKIQTATHVFLEGELIYREYDRTIETESGPIKVRWPLTEILVESLSVLDRPQKQERKGAA